MPASTISSPSAWLLLFFFPCYGDHRDLHSFPTRRSSDLACRRRHGQQRICPGQSTAVAGTCEWQRTQFIPSVHDRDAARPESLSRIGRRQDASGGQLTDRKSTRLNSSHRCISYAVFCLKK